MDAKAIVNESFANGQLVVDPNETNEKIGQLVRIALEESHGMPFTVIQSLGSVVFDDLKETMAKYKKNER